jgi:hypothetical protein
MTERGDINQIRTAIDEVAGILTELRDCLERWNQSGWNLDNSRKYRSIAKRVVLASRSLEQVVKENTFSRP